MVAHILSKSEQYLKKFLPIHYLNLDQTRYQMRIHAIPCIWLNQTWF